MKVSRDEAATALDEVDESRRRVSQRIDYRYSARLFFLWGSAWILANVLSDIARTRGALIWDVIVTLAACLSHNTSSRRRCHADCLPWVRQRRRYGTPTFGGRDRAYRMPILVLFDETIITAGVVTSQYPPELNSFGSGRVIQPSCV
jgi:hypothetical protein